MDHLSLRKYRRTISGVEGSRKKRTKSKRLQTGGPRLTHHALKETEREFLEFYINDKPLSELLDKFYPKGSILDDLIGVLGWSVNKNSEIIKVKQLLGKNISDKEIRQCYPAEWSNSEFQSYLVETREELADPEILLYGCPACGDYECGGITVKIDKTANTFVWTIGEEDKRLAFEFDKHQYFELFNKYVKQLEKTTNTENA